MTFPDRPGVRPGRPYFSSGPCAKRPGWTRRGRRRARLARPLAPRRRAEGAAEIGDRPHRAAARRCRPTGGSASCPARTPAPSRWRCGRCSAPRPVDLPVWESFGEGWATDAVKQLKLPDARVHRGRLRRAARPRRGAARGRRRLHLERHDQRRARAGCRLDRRRPAGAGDLRRHLGGLRAAARLGRSSMSSPSPGRRRWAARAAMA